MNMTDQNLTIFYAFIISCILTKCPKPLTGIPPNQHLQDVSDNALVRSGASLYLLYMPALLLSFICPIFSLFLRTYSIPSYAILLVNSSLVPCWCRNTILCLWSYHHWYNFQSTRLLRQALLWCYLVINWPTCQLTCMHRREHIFPILVLLQWLQVSFQID